MKWNWGWTLRADHWGHGYATEAAQACLDWGFATLDNDYFTALMRPGNEASVKVAERLGFSPRRELQGSPVTVYALELRPGQGGTTARIPRSRPRPAADHVLPPAVGPDGPTPHTVSSRQARHAARTSTPPAACAT
ncbi:GNAT family N-acetyltransferase [Streptomyces sp. NBC_00378]|uniref:GNAT family N-acetyltransferase n=1 Tax=unclassified Streptomyces TaxID=2593676 RepID=UPI00225B27C7|nr:MULTISPECIES: GNAT family N-acetyltransferase [unclassified Streptomyces]MCX5114848.1 GNAT family N-acetyltransferase [Streptomyces sp. NBC_00378]